MGFYVEKCLVHARWGEKHVSILKKQAWLCGGKAVHRWLSVILAKCSCSVQGQSVSGYWFLEAK